jgi:hypothetical protein
MTVAENFLVLDGLGCREQASVESKRAFGFVHNLRAFIRNADDCITGFALRPLFDFLEDLFKAIDVALRLGVVFRKLLFQVGRLRGLLHLGECCEDFLFGEIDVFEGSRETARRASWVLWPWRPPVCRF